MLRQIVCGLLLSSCLLGGISGCMKETPPPAIVTKPPVPLEAPAPGGAVQGIRKAVARTVSQAQMKDLHLFLENASAGSESGKLPTPKQTIETLKTDPSGRVLSSLIADGDIVLVGNPSRESVWAYTKDAPTKGGIVISSSGVETLPADQVQQRLR